MRPKLKLKRGARARLHADRAPRRPAGKATPTEPTNGVKANLPTAAMLNQGGVMCYNAFVRECGYKDDARIPEWRALKEHQKARWCTIAKDVYGIMEAHRAAQIEAALSIS